MSYNYLWRAWYNMIKRCTDPSAPNYQLYGGRGITVCRSWLTSFSRFSADVGSRPGDGYSLDRINNDSGYRKSNVRWATGVEQANNRRSSVRINGKSPREVSNECGVSMAAIYKRLQKGMVDDAVASPADLRLKPIRHGSIAGYSRGCKCVLCKAANAKKRRDYLNKKRNQ